MSNNVTIIFLINEHQRRGIFRAVGGYLIDLKVIQDIDKIRL